MWMCDEKRKNNYNFRVKPGPTDAFPSCAVVK